MKAHMEAIHFPSELEYNCTFCDKTCKTKNALACHVSKYHSSLKA